MKKFLHILFLLLIITASFVTIKAYAYDYTECVRPGFGWCGGYNWGQLGGVNKSTASCNNLGWSYGCMQQNTCGSGWHSPYVECGDTTQGACRDTNGSHYILVYKCDQYGGDSAGGYACFNQGQVPGQCGVAPASIGQSCAQINAKCVSGSHCDSSSKVCVADSTPPPTGTPTPAPSQGPLPTTGAVTVQFETLGPDENGNIVKPHNPNRQLVLYFYTDTAFQHLAYQSTLDNTSIVSFNAAGYFANAAFPLTGLPSGSYYILVKSPQGSLMAQIGSGDGTGPIAITGGQNNLLVDPTQNSQNTTADTTIPLLAMGDLYAAGTDFNNVSLQDWNIVKDCFGSTPTTLSSACSSHTGMIDPTTHVFLPDMNDDGVVDGIDYTILMRHFGQYGAGQTAKIN